METKYWSEKMASMSTAFSSGLPTNGEMRRAELIELAKVRLSCAQVRHKPDIVLSTPPAPFYPGTQKLQTFIANLSERFGSPGVIKNFFLISYVNVFNTYLNASEGEKICYKIGLLTIAIWAAWQMPGWKTFMTRSFTHNPLSGLSYTLLTSVFR
jgi:hypothetical protein